MLEYLRAIDALPRAISEGQVLGVALHEGAPLHEPARRLREQRLGEIDPATPGIGYLGQEVSGAAADLQHSVLGTCREQGQDATDPLALDVPDQRTRVIVELLDVVLLDHRVVPRLELAEIAKGARAHDRPTDRGVDTNRPAFTMSSIAPVLRQGCRARSARRRAARGHRAAPSRRARGDVEALPRTGASRRTASGEWETGIAPVAGSRTPRTGRLIARGRARRRRLRSDRRSRIRYTTTRCQARPPMAAASAY